MTSSTRRRTTSTPPRSPTARGEARHGGRPRRRDPRREGAQEAGLRRHPRRRRRFDPPAAPRAHLRTRARRLSKKVALVGKGITFDTGGISIKPAAGMDEMTSDMSGAAAIVATMVLAAKLKYPLEIIASIPMAENMPSGDAYRPGDVLTMYGGKTVEVLNTDAEGRLILSDAIVRACEDEPGLPDRDLDADRRGGRRARQAHRGRHGLRRVPRPRGRASARPSASRRGPCRCPRSCARTSTRGSRTSRTSPGTAGAACSPPGCSCASSWPRASSGRTSTSRARRSTRVARSGYTDQGRHRRSGADHRGRAGGHRRQRLIFGLWLIFICDGRASFGSSARFALPAGRSGRFATPRAPLQ